MEAGRPGRELRPPGQRAAGSGGCKAGRRLATDALPREGCVGVQRGVSDSCPGVNLSKRRSPRLQREDACFCREGKEMPRADGTSFDTGGTGFACSALLCSNVHAQWRHGQNIWPICGRVSSSLSDSQECPQRSVPAGWGAGRVCSALRISELNSALFFYGLCMVLILFRWLKKNQRNNIL